MKLKKLAFTTWQFLTVILGIYLSCFGVPIIPGLITGKICNNIAKDKGLDERWAFIYGFSWSIFALIWYIAEEPKKASISKNKAK